MTVTTPTLFSTSARVTWTRCARWTQAWSTTPARATTWCSTAAWATGRSRSTIVLADLSTTATVKRAVTNVGGNRGAVYRASVASQHGGGGGSASYYVTVARPVRLRRGRLV
jgi:hypothetical protein